MLHWLHKRPCRRAMSLHKHPKLPMLNEAAPPVTFNQYIKVPLQGIYTLKTVPPINPSHTSTKEKSKNPSNFSLGYVAPFVANLMGNALATQSTCVAGQCGPMLSLDIEGAPTNTTNDVERHLHPISTL
jgi:hypothetical protein